jgi:hypothetical protein
MIGPLFKKLKQPLAHHLLLGLIVEDWSVTGFLRSGVCIEHT